MLKNGNLVKFCISFLTFCEEARAGLDRHYTNFNTINNIIIIIVINLTLHFFWGGGFNHGFVLKENQQINSQFRWFSFHRY